MEQFDELYNIFHPISFCRQIIIILSVSYITANLYCICHVLCSLKQMQYRYAVNFKTISNFHPFDESTPQTFIFYPRQNPPRKVENLQTCTKLKWDCVPNLHNTALTTAATEQKTPVPDRNIEQQPQIDYYCDEVTEITSLGLIDTKGQIDIPLAIPDFRTRVQKFAKQVSEVLPVYSPFVCGCNIQLV